jgi:DNA repair ATPase RecN
MQSMRIMLISIIFLLNLINIISAFHGVTISKCRRTKTSSQFAVQNSYIEKVICRNYGGLINGDTSSGSENNGEIAIKLGPNLTAVSGETGSGKSLLIVKILDLILGTKATSTMLPSSGDSSAEGEVIFKLTEPHLSFVKKVMAENDVNPDLLTIQGDNGFGTLVLNRKIFAVRSGTTSKIKSECRINGKNVTLKKLMALTSPLIAIVDASAAASMLAQPQARMNIIDTGVPSDILSDARKCKIAYRNARKSRERIERELADRVLPSSFTDGDADLELYRHWIDELDSFEKRMNTFQDKLSASKGSTLIASTGEYGNGDNSIGLVLKRFLSASWQNDATSNGDSSFDKSFYTAILDLRDGIKALDDKLISAHASCEVLTALSHSTSVAVALEESRRHLYDVASGSTNDSIFNVTEKSHELLNKLEDALNAASKFIADDSQGLICTLENIRQGIMISVEDLDTIIGDWSALSRKHGVSPYSLPSLQRSLRQELDGNVEAKAELPKAQEKERKSLKVFEKSCKGLSEIRTRVADELSKSVTRSMVSLGMDGSSFDVDFKGMVYQCTDSICFSDSTMLGLDVCDFKLLHRQINSERSMEKLRIIKNVERGGNLEIVGSSGEKARILLAIETHLPGSIGASCNKVSTEVLSDGIPPPVAVVYDEIDAHVGGRAVVALAKLLSAQTRPRNNFRGSQIISITHNPSVAAIADCHVVIQKQIVSENGEKRTMVVTANTVEGEERKQEIARMASGDLAQGEEGLRFAEALLKGSGKY